MSSACLGGTEAGGGGGGDAGGTIEVFGAFTDTDADNFEAAYAPFEEETGYDVQFTGSADFETLITTRCEGGDAPDVAIFPQPGLLADSVEPCDIQPIGDFVDVEELEGSIVPGLLDAATIDGDVVGVPYRLAVKSLVWYPVPEFEEAGYQIPETHEELTELVDQIKADGNTPWCLGIEAGGATGWPVTDGLEEEVLRLSGPEVVDQWVSHEIPFDAPEIVAAGEAFADLYLEDGNSVGGAQGIVTTSAEAAPAPLFDDPPGCYLYRQGNFATDFFPDDAVLGEDVNLFYYPQYEDAEGGEQPVLGGGDLVSLLGDAGEPAQEFMQYLATPEGGQAWVEAGGFLSPHQSIDPASYPNDVVRQIGTILSEASAFSFDPSDRMPGAVGAGSFWTESVAWINGGASLEEALANIEASWPASGGGEAESEG